MVAIIPNLLYPHVNQHRLVCAVESLGVGKTMLLHGIILCICSLEKQNRGQPYWFISSHENITGMINYQNSEPHKFALHGQKTIT